MEHMSKVLRKEESFKEAGQNIAIETGKAAYNAAKTAFVDDMTAEKIEDSSRELIRQIPVVETGTQEVESGIQPVESGMHAYQCAINYAQGRTDFQEFAFEMGDKIARNAGKAAGTERKQRIHGREAARFPSFIIRRHVRFGTAASSERAAHRDGGDGGVSLPVHRRFRAERFDDGK